MLAACVLCLLGLEVALRCQGGPGGNWFASSPQHQAFLERHVRRNTQGFRDREFTPKRPGSVRILAVGDSFTFGDSIVDVADTWPRVLEQRLRSAGRDVEVLNLGWSGTNTQDQCGPAEQLVPPGEARLGDAAKEPRRGIRSKVCVADWNGDGLPDLLLGDYATQKPDRTEPTAEERAEHARIRGELSPIEARHRTLVDRLYGRARVKDKDASEKPLRQKLPPEYEQHGWIRLFLRKPRAS
ncbi:MAG: hypothetical protein U1E76_15815 [Planctomycetota bacterium]